MTTKVTRQAWAVARRAIDGQRKTCVDKGHPVYRVGPYLICRSLRCETLVVKE